MSAIRPQPISTGPPLAKDNPPLYLFSPLSPISPLTVPLPRYVAMPIMPVNSSLKDNDTNNASHQLSYECTSLAGLFLWRPEYHAFHSKGGQDFNHETTGPIEDKYDPINGYVGSVGPIRETVELGEFGVVETAVLEPGVGITWPESRVRSSIAREKKRRRNVDPEEKIQAKRGRS